MRGLRHPAISLGILLAMAGGCSPIPRGRGRPALTTQAQADQLRRDVKFFSQPSLRGRKCRSSESRTVRHYIRQRFEDLRLEPWAKTRSIDASFSLGTNVIGVLPGSDPKLAGSYILVCTHYDGPGVVKDKILPDATGSGAPTAVLLDIAGQLAGQKKSLRRSVVFAAFDCGEERYLGAFAFTGRRDFDATQIAAIVDLTMLGRPLFNVVNNEVIALGATGSPDLRSTATQAAMASSLRLVPLGADLAGPVSDSFAFQQWPIPCLVLTNGLCSDYQKPTDTADKIDYDLLEETADLAARVVRDLANRTNIAPPPEEPPADKDELRAIIAVLDEVCEKAAANDLTPGEVQTFERLATRARQLVASKDYTGRDRRQLISEMVLQGLPSIIRFFYDPPKPPLAKVISPAQVATLLRYQEFFARHAAFASRALQQVVRYYTEGWTFLRLLGSYGYTGCDIHGDEIIYQRQGRDYRLSALYPRMMIQASLSARKFDVTWTPVDFRGTPGEVVDFCLLTWAEQPEGCLSDVMPKVLAKVTGQSLGPRFQDWLDWRLGQTGAKDEAQWLSNLWQTDNSLLLKGLLARVAGGKQTVFVSRLVDIIGDANIRADVRAEAIRALPANLGREAMPALAGLVDDRTATFQRQYLPAFDPSFAFYNNIIMQVARRLPESHEQATLGQVALRKLILLTDQDFGADPRAWREWIEGHR